MGTGSLRLLNDRMPGQPARAGARPALRRLHRRLRHRPSCFRTPCCTGRTWARPTPSAGPAPLRRPVLHLQRRRTGHRRRSAGGGVRRGQGERDRMADQRVVIHGSRHGGVGIADMLREVMVGAGLTPEEATRRFWCLDPQGADHRRPPGRPARLPATLCPAGGRGRQPLPAPARAPRWPTWSARCMTMLIGTSTQAGAFTEAIVRQMAAHVDRPVIMPLSNPTSKAEAVPADLIAWTDGRGPGRHRQPLRPGCPRRDHLPDRPGQQRAGLPGLGLGVAVAQARQVQRPHAGGGRRRGRRAVGRQHPRGAAAAAGRQPARGVRDRRRGRRQGRRRRRPRRGGPATRSTRSTRPCGSQSTPASRRS